MNKNKRQVFKDPEIEKRWRESGLPLLMFLDVLEKTIKNREKRKRKKR